MKVKLTSQAQEFLGQSELVVITERVDDLGLDSSDLAGLYLERR